MWVIGYNNYELLKFIACMFVIAIAVAIILRVYDVKSLFLGDGVNGDLESISHLRKQDLSRIRKDKLLRIASAIAKIHLFKIDAYEREEWEYLIRRGNIRANGRVMSVEEFRGAVIAVIIAIDLFCAIIAIMGYVVTAIIISVIVTLNTFIAIKLFLKASVEDKDKEFRSEFLNLYINIHYVLMVGGDTPIIDLIKMYTETSNSAEMKQFETVAYDYISSYGELRAMGLLTATYRDMPEVCRMCRLIEQSLMGGNVKEELEGFRDELIVQKDVEIEKRSLKAKKNAELTVYVAFIVIMQVAVNVYASLIPGLGGIFGK